MGTRILTVEDDERIRTAVKLALEDEGWTVDEAGSGEEAIELFQRATPDVVLIDIMLPGKDGFAVATELRAAGLEVAPHADGVALYFPPLRAAAAAAMLALFGLACSLIGLASMSGLASSGSEESASLLALAFAA